MEYDYLSGYNLHDLLRELAQRSKDGWSLASSHFEPAQAYGKNGTHWLIIHRISPVNLFASRVHVGGGGDEREREVP